MAHLLGAEGIGVEYPNKVVLDGVTLGVADGDRIGVVGRNGDGKSTLVSLLAGRIAPDTGQVVPRRGLRIGMVDQTDALDASATVRHAIVGDRPEHAWAGDARIRSIVAGLAGGLDPHARVGDLSGGQRRRVALAAVLVDDWDVLILDEPTNHLDVEGITWLAEHLNGRWPTNDGALIVVTHDRWFLDAVATSMWEVHDRTVSRFEGGYAAWVLQRAERAEQAAAAEARRRNLLRKELAWLRRGPPARTAKPRFRIEAANALIADVPPLRDRVELARLAGARLGKQVVDLLDVSVAYGEHTVLESVEWRLAPGERSGIIGANGSGKSTLLGLIAGSVTPTSGAVRRGATVRLGILDQRLDTLDRIGAELVRDVVTRTRTTFEVDGRSLSAAQLLERLGFGRQYLSSPVAELSGGQRRRLQLLMVLLDEPNVLLLDEPSNDFDTEMLTALEDLLDQWPGTLVVVSHDRHLLERVTDQQYAILDARLRHLPGGVDEYLALRGGRPAPVVGSEHRTATDGALREAARKELNALERRIARLEREVAGLRHEAETHDPTDHVGLTEITDRIRHAEAELDAAETRWLELG